MNPYQSERILSYFYPLIILFGFVCSVTSAIAWNHWKIVLDTCVERNCGCILNGVSTITYFTGGNIIYCHYATFGLLLSIGTALFFGSFHVWRTCMMSGGQRTNRHAVRQRSGEIIVMTAQSEVDNGISLGYWTPAAFISGFMAFYSLIHAIAYVDGAWHTCKQYRNEIIKHISATGSLVAAVQGRISCSAVFDFMDYLFSDVSFDRRRFDRIDTSWCLNLAIFSSIASFLLWCGIFFINVSQARHLRKLRG